jgi:hypothetical protein
MPAFLKMFDSKPNPTLGWSINKEYVSEAEKLILACHGSIRPENMTAKCMSNVCVMWSPYRLVSAVLKQPQKRRF